VSATSEDRLKAGAGWHLTPGRLFMAFIRRDWRIAISYRFGFATDLVHSFIGLVFLFFLGRLVGHGLSHNASLTHGYFSFALLGVAMLGVVSTAITAVSDQLRTDQMTGTLEILLAMPPPSWLVVMGSAVYQVVYAMATGVVMVVLGLAFGLHLQVQALGAFVVVVGLLLSLIMFTGLGVAFASLVVLFKRGNIIQTYAGAVFTLLGGVYYPVSLLPVGLRVLADLVPITWSIDVIRTGLLDAEVPWASFGVLAAWTVAVVPVSMWMLTMAVARARRQGTLSQY
jgi:ABC-2 type transport system permease protein